MRLRDCVRWRERCVPRETGEHKLTREALEESRRKLRTAARLAQLTYWEEDIAANRLTIPREGYRLLGLPVPPADEPHTFERLIEFVHAEDRARLREARRQSLEHGLNPKVTVRLVLPGGEVRHIEIAAESVPGREGREARAVGAIQDITARMEVEQSLRESQERLHLALQATGLGPWEWDLRTNSTKFWPAWTRQLGYEPDELPNEYEEWEKRLHPLDRDRVLAGLHDYLEGRASEYATEFRLRHRNGTWRWIFTRGAMLRDAEGRPTHMLGCHLDITERKRLEEQFLHAQRMEAIGQLAGGVAHDFNNILTVILAESDLLLTILPAEEPREMVLEIRQAAERAAALTRQLLAFSRRAVIEPQLLDLNAVIRESERMLRRLIGEDVRLVTNLHEEVDAIRVDPGQVAQVLMNLVVNARDAMPTGGTLSIATRRVTLDDAAAAFFNEAKPGRYVTLAVTDTGVGMSREVIDHIFEPFFTTKGPQYGTGLGLATVYGIMKQGGGFSAVHSEPGHGTTFRLYFPAAEGAIVRATSGAQPVTGGGAETILVVEDDQVIRSLLRRVLERSGYTVLDAATGRDALQLAGRHAGPIHLIVTDVVMPEMGGRQVVEHLSALRPGIGVLYLSGYTDDAVVRHGVQRAEVAFLAKPFTLATLAARVREVLDERTQD